MSDKPINIKFFSKVVEFLKCSRQQVLQIVTHTMVSTYFQIGRMIVEEEQDGEALANYGKTLLKVLFKVLKAEFGKGFSVDNLENMRHFYLLYGKSETVSRKSKNVTLTSFYVMRKTFPELLFEDLTRIIEEGRKQLAVQINNTLTPVYRQVGNRINKDLLDNERAAYGKEIVVTVAGQLEKNMVPLMRTYSIFSRGSPLIFF